MKKETYEITVAGLKRSLPLCPLNEKLQIGAFVIFGDPELTTACAVELNRRLPDHDVMITAESKGIPLVNEMARLQGNKRYVLARKSKKLYMKNVVEAKVRSITTDAIQTLYLDGADAEYMRGKRVLIVDDVISTGESVNALNQLVLAVGGCIVGQAAILAEGDAAERSDLIFLEKLPLFDADGDPI